jgi:hypothetical protein
MKQAGYQTTNSSFNTIQAAVFAGIRRHLFFRQGLPWLLV